MTQLATQLFKKLPAPALFQYEMVSGWIPVYTGLPGPLISLFAKRFRAALFKSNLKDAWLSRQA
jgi:hypothetical protein